MEQTAGCLQGNASDYRDASGWILVSYPEIAQLPCYMSHLQVCHLIQSSRIPQDHYCKESTKCRLTGIGRIIGDPYGGKRICRLGSSPLSFASLERVTEEKYVYSYVSTLHLCQGPLFSSTLRKKPTAAFHSSSSRHMNSHDCELGLLGLSENLWLQNRALPLNVLFLRCYVHNLHLCNTSKISYWCLMHLFLSSPWLNSLLHLHHHWVWVWKKFTEQWESAPCLCAIFTEGDWDFYITLSVLKV